MKNNLHILPLALAALGCLAAWAAKPSGWDEQALRNKTQLYNMAAAEAYAVERYDDYFVAAMQAYALDSTDVDAACQWGLLMNNIHADSAVTQRAYDAVMARFLSDPGNLALGGTLAGIANRMKHPLDVVTIWQKLDSAYPTMTDPAENLANAYLVASMVVDSAYFDKAMAIYSRLEAGSGKDVGLSSQKVRAYAMRNDTVSIIAEVDSLLAYAPQNPMSALFAGGTYEYLGDRDKALEYYDMACGLDSTNGNAIMAKVRLYAAMDDSVAYEREVVKALGSNTLEMEDKLDLFVNYVAKYHDDDSQEQNLRNLFASMEHMHPGTPEVHDLYSRYLFVRGDNQGAIEEIGFAVDLDHENEQLRIRQIQMNVAGEKYADVVAFSTDAMHRFPDNMYFPIMAASGYQQLGNLSAGIALLDSVEHALTDVENDQAFGSLLSVKGDLQFLSGDTVGAITTYDKAIAADPGNAMALNNAAYYMSLVDSDLDKAEQYSLRSMRLDESNPTYLDTYAWIQFKKKDYGLAKQYIDMAINAFEHPDVAETDTVAADEAAAEGEVVEEAAAVGSADIYEHAGDIYFFAGEPQKAVDFWQKAAAMDPDNKRLQRKVAHKTYFYQ